MSSPQRPEPHLAVPPVDVDPGPVSIPPGSAPGHHPEVEQDRPSRRPPAGARRRPPARAGRRAPRRPPAGTPSPARFPFAFDPRLLLLAAPLGVTPLTAHVEVGRSDLHVRFGPWSLRTPLDNVRDMTETGPYRWWRVAGPARISLADGGVTFATNTRRGLCIRFAEPVAAGLPHGLLRHPGATVTVADPGALAAAIAARPGRA